MLGFNEQIAKNTIIFNHHNTIAKKRKVSRQERLNSSQIARQYGKDLIKAKEWIKLCEK